MKRTPLRPVSKNRQRVNRERRILQEAAWGPRPWKCQFMQYVRESGLFIPAEMAICHGEVNGHEILKRSRAGSTDANLLDVENQVPLCDRHNSLVETEPKLGHEIGLAKHAWEDE